MPARSWKNTLKRVGGALAGGGSVLFSGSGVMSKSNNIFGGIRQTIIGTIATASGLPPSLISTLFALTATVILVKVFGKFVTTAITVGWIFIVTLIVLSHFGIAV